MTDRTRARRSDATANRERILDAARAAFGATGSETSMAEVVRRSRLGAGTIYRHFADRQALLEALLADEVDEMCAAAATVEGPAAADRLENWLRRFFRYVTVERPVVLDLLVLTGPDEARLRLETRERLVAAGRPLLLAAQQAHEVRAGLDAGQVLDLVMAIAKIRGPASYTGPLLDVALAGLRAGR